MKNLIARVEAATPDEQREVLEAAFDAIFGDGPITDDVGSTDWQVWTVWHAKFTRMLDAEAYLDAARMLVPDEISGRQVFPLIHKVKANEWRVNLGVAGPKAQGTNGIASTSALALTAAALRARVIMSHAAKIRELRAEIDRINSEQHP